MENKYLSKDKLVGKQVIDSTATIVGDIKDLAFDFEAKETSLTITAKSGQEILVSSNNISSVGDVILLDRKVEVPKQSSTPSQIKYSSSPAKEISTPTQSGLCRNCNFQNDPNARFCIKCGSKL